MTTLAPTRSPLTVLRANAAMGKPGILVIAAGTEWEIAVRDVRSFIQWSTPGPHLGPDPRRVIVYHHTAAGRKVAKSVSSELGALIEMARSSTWGLPYNFVVFPFPPFRIYYLNDVDRAWPHTLNANWATAIAAYGNFSEQRVDDRLPTRMRQLADALATMWQRWVPETQHRQWTPTECPGTNLAPLLPLDEA